MPANRFMQAQPAQDNYFNTFVPLPLEQLTALGMSRKADLEKNQALIDKMYNDVSNIQAAPGTADETYLKTKLLPQLTDMAMSYANVDLSQPQEVAKLRRQMRATVDPTVVKNIEQTHAGWLKANQMEAQMRANGTWSDKLNKNPITGWDSANQGAYNWMPEAYEGKASLFDPILKHLKPNEYMDLAHGVMVSEIKPEDIDKVAAANAADLVSTPKGRQELRLFKEDYPDVAKRLGSDEAIMRHLINDFGADQLGGKNLTPLPYEWLRSMNGTGGSSTKTPLGQENSYMPMPGKDASTGTYKGDKTRSADLDTQIADMDKTIEATSDPSLKSKFAAMKGGMLDEKKRIDDVIAASTEQHAPEFQNRKDGILSNYYNSMKDKGYSKKVADDMLKGVEQEGDTGWAARMGIEGGSQFMSNPLGRVGDAMLSTGKVLTNLLIGAEGSMNPTSWADAAVKKAEIEALRTKMHNAPGFNEFSVKEAMDTYLKLHDLKTELEDKVATDYKQASVKSKQDIGILMAGSGITDKGSTETDTRTGKLKIPNTSLMLRDLKVSAGKYANIEDITAVDRDRDLLTKDKDIHGFISNADNIGLESIGASTRPDGTYPVVITATKSLGSGKGTTTKRFKMNLNENTNPYETQSWRRAAAKDLEDKGLYKEADRISDPSIEKQVVAGKHNPTFSVQLDRANKFNFKNNEDGTYTELDDNGQPALINGQPAVFTDEEIIQNLYWLKNKHKYESPNKFNTVGE